YTTHLDIKFDPLALIDVDQLAKSVTDEWYNQTLCRVNDSVVRLGVMQGKYHWHKHDNDDEFFYVLSGRFIIDLEGRSVELLPNQGFVVPKGVMHCTRAPQKASSSWSRRRQLSRRATREIVYNLTEAAKLSGWSRRDDRRLRAGGLEPRREPPAVTLFRTDGHESYMFCSAQSE
ncbi:MAG: cupin domain-containing protein, partial [Acetobacteraceae bacterium]|nr:cupin domain-containing protein [Acetobacteraceae bacterium]